MVVGPLMGTPKKYSIIFVHCLLQFSLGYIKVPIARVPIASVSQKQQPFTGNGDEVTLNVVLP